MPAVAQLSSLKSQGTRQEATLNVSKTRPRRRLSALVRRGRAPRLTLRDLVRCRFVRNGRGRRCRRAVLAWTRRSYSLGVLPPGGQVGISVDRLEVERLDRRYEPSALVECLGDRGGRTHVRLAA